MGAKIELFKRYREVWQLSWKNRVAMQGAQRQAHELQFLPASLALQDTPVHPAPRYFQWGIIVFAALGLLWACLGQIDVVATATGKIVPSGKTKLIQPSEVAVVKNIYVRDGQVVKAGDVLVDLDAQITGAEVERLQSDRMAAAVDEARATALLNAIATGNPPDSLAALMPDATPVQQQAAQRWVEGQYLELRSSMDQAQATIEQQQAELQAVNANIQSLEASLPITRQLAADYKGLQDKGVVGKHAYLQREQARLDQERQLQVQRTRLIEVQAAKREAEQRLQGVIAQTRRAMLDLQQNSAQKVAALTQELKKAEQRNRLMHLTSPVDGTVQQLAIHTQGGVVTEAQPLMVIVPSDEPVEVEAFLENKDIGFVHPGQDVEVKVETFNFTKYGVVHGTVVSVSNDAIEDEKRGLVYSTRIRLKENNILVGNQYINLSPGMAVRAEVKTDQRRVIDYFLSPLQEYQDQSLKER